MTDINIVSWMLFFIHKSFPKEAIIMETKNIPDFVELRSLNGAYREIKRRDPGNTISKAYLRELVESEQIRSYRRGNKRILSLADIEAYFTRPTRK